MSPRFAARGQTRAGTLNWEATSNIQRRFSLPVREACRSDSAVVPSEGMNADVMLLDSAEANHRVVSRAMVETAGLTPRQWQLRLKAGEWVQVVPGVWRHRATAETFELRVHATALALGNEAALSGAAAAAWWELEGFAPEHEEVLFTVPRARRWESTTRVRSSRDWRPGDLIHRREVRVTNVTRTILDLAAFGEVPRRIEGAIDSGIRRRLTSVPTLQRRIAEAGGRGRTGVPLLRELMLDSGGESALERRFLRLMRQSDLPRPRAQVAYAREACRAMRVDFEFSNGLVVEVSGRLGHTSDRDRQKDARRRNALQAQGIPFAEFTTADVMEDPAYVVATVADRLS